MDEIPPQARGPSIFESILGVSNPRPGDDAWRVDSADCSPGIGSALRDHPGSTPAVSGRDDGSQARAGQQIASHCERSQSTGTRTGDLGKRRPMPPVTRAHPGPRGRRFRRSLAPRGALSWG